MAAPSFYSLSGLVDQVSSIYHSLSRGNDFSSAVDLSRTLEAATEASLLYGPTFTGKDDDVIVSYDPDAIEENPSPYEGNPFQKAAASMAGDLRAYMLIEVIENGTGGGHRAANAPPLKLIRNQIAEFLLGDDQAPHLKDHQAEQLVQAIANMWLKVDVDSRAWAIAGRYIVAKEAANQEEMDRIREEVGPPDKIKILSIAMTDDPVPVLYDRLRSIE